MLPTHDRISELETLITDTWVRDLNDNDITASGQIFIKKLQYSFKVSAN
jgi:hypothetical protein